jgi:hypothetical protein
MTQRALDEKLDHAKFHIRRAGWHPLRQRKTHRLLIVEYRQQQRIAIGPPRGQLIRLGRPNFGKHGKSASLGKTEIIEIIAQTALDELQVGLALACVPDADNHSWDVSQSARRFKCKNPGFSGPGCGLACRQR